MSQHIPVLVGVYSFVHSSQIYPKGLVGADPPVPYGLCPGDGCPYAGTDWGGGAAVPNASSKGFVPALAAVWPEELANPPGLMTAGGDIGCNACCVAGWLACKESCPICGMAACGGGGGGITGGGGGIPAGAGAGAIPPPRED